MNEECVGFMSKNGGSDADGDDGDDVQQLIKAECEIDKVFQNLLSLQRSSAL